MKTVVTVLLSLILTGLTGCGERAPDSRRTVPQAEPSGQTSSDIGDHVVHYNALSTDQLSAEVAKHYGIVRSENRAMINISIIDERNNESAEGEVTVRATNLTGQLKNVTMRKIQEQDAIYYIGELPVANRETLSFAVNVKPQGVEAASQFVFQNQFFSD